MQAAWLARRGWIVLLLQVGGGLVGCHSVVVLLLHLASFLVCLLVSGLFPSALSNQAVLFV